MDCVCKFCPIKMRLEQLEKDVPYVNYFRFPKDKVLLQEWAIFCGKSTFFEAKKAKLCSIHFKSEDLIENVPFKLGFSSVKWKLRPGAVPCLATEEDLAREKARLDKQNKVYRKKLVDEIIDVAIKETLDEPTMLIEVPTEGPMSDPIGTDIETPPEQDSSISNTTTSNFCSESDNYHFNETQERLTLPEENIDFSQDPIEEIDDESGVHKEILTLPEENIDFSQDPIEEIDDECGVHKEINILLKRYRMKGAKHQFNMILKIKREFYKLNAKQLELRKNKEKLHIAINNFNERIEKDKDYINYLKEQLKECQPFEFPNSIKSRRRRLWTRIEIETALEEFLTNGRLYRERMRTECIPGVRTLQKWRLEQYPNKKRAKYQLICQEDTIERGVKNLGFEVDKPKVQEKPALLPDVIPNPQFIFPEDNPERGVADLLDPKILELNDIVRIDSCQSKKNEVDQTNASLLCFQHKNDLSDEFSIVYTFAHK